MGKRRKPKRGGSQGMLCPSCKHNISHIYDTRGHETLVRRFRKCVKCDHSYVTEETIACSISKTSYI